MLAVLYYLAVSTAPADVLIPEIAVTGVATSIGDVAPTASVLGGAALTQKRRATIGETLRGEAGVTSSDYGPNASRPIIRGLGGDRVRVLQNGVGVLDASGASDDHAIAVEPLSIEKIELVRGPAALLYGSQAVGGVVNLITGRVPEVVPAGTSGRLESQYSSTDDGRSVGMGLDTRATERAPVHADFSARGAESYLAPANRRVPNSQARTTSAAVGASYVFTNGFFGGSYADYQSSYGTVAERFVAIDLRQRRFDLGGEVRGQGFVRSLRVKNSFSLYAHDEVDHGETGTRFRSAGDELRIDVVHRPVEGVNGRFGLQGNGFTFSARGDEGFLPETKTRSGGVFVFEERARGTWRPSAGARLDVTHVGSETDAAFGPGQTKRFTGGSGSLGLLYQLTPADALLANVSYTQRAPNYQELFARGPHAATHAYEVGDPNLGLEKSAALELSWRRESARVNVFAQDFAGFVALSPTGRTDPDGALPIYDFRATDARLFGAEAEWRRPLPIAVPGGRLELGLKADLAHGEDRRTGRPLPRITPTRETVTLTYRGDRLRGDVEVQRSERQDRLAEFERPTAAYVVVNLNVEYPVTYGRLDGAAFARLNNAFDTEARNHVSLLKEIAPLPGRSVVAGVRATF